MFQLPKIEIPKINYLSLSMAQIKAMSDKELEKALAGEAGDGIVPITTQNLIIAELNKRVIERASKPHWTLIPVFLFTAISVIFAIWAYFHPLQP